MQHIIGISRQQLQISSLEDKITQDNPVRFIEAFVENISLEAMSFIVKTLKNEGRPGFDTKVFPNLVLVADEHKRRLAISNQRIKSIDDQNVTFEYKDYRVAGVKKQMTLTHQEFIRRFALHILPKRFVKIRYYGFLSSIP